MTIGLIGYGTWGKLIHQTLSKFPLDVVVMDQNFALANEIHNFCPSIHGLLERQPNAIIVATPASTHVDILLQLLPLEIPLFVEKPFVISLRQFEEIRQWLHSEVFVMHIWKYHPGIQLLKKLITGEEIGQILYAKSMRCNWTSPRKDVDSIWNLVPHDLTIAEYLFNHMPVPQFAKCELHQGIPRSMVGILGQNPFYHFEVSNRYFEKRREIRIHGTDGIMKFSGDQYPFIEIYYGDHTSMPDQVKHKKLPVEGKSALFSELEVFIKYLNGTGPKPITDWREAERVIKTTEYLRFISSV